MEQTLTLLLLSVDVLLNVRRHLESNGNSGLFSSL